MLETYMKLRMIDPDCPEKFFLPLKLGKWAKTGFVEYIEKFCH